jgi:predicted phosphodiesterase
MKFRFKKIALTVIFLIVLGAISSVLVNNCRGTAHEKGPNQSVAIGQNKDVEILTEGCFLRGQDGLTLHLKADSLTPRVVLTPKSGQEKNLKLVMDNISPDLLTVDGANVLERIPREKKMVVEVSITPAKPTAVEWKLSRVEEKVSFFVFGDNRNTYDVLEEIREDIARERPLFVINVGDLVSRGTKEQMLKHEEFANSVPVPYFTVLGNHDLEKGKRASAEPYYEVFGPTYYSFWYGPYFFGIIDDADGYMSLRELQWLNKELKNSQDAKERFVFAHQPPFDPRRGHHHAMKPLISGAPLLSFIIGREGVDYFITGHIHTYYEFQKGPTRYVISGDAKHGGVEPMPISHYVIFKIGGDKVVHFLRLVEEGKSELK